MRAKKKNGPALMDISNTREELPGGKITPGSHEILQDEMISRLKKIEGQVRGVQKMIKEKRLCSDIVIQLAAIKAAVNRVGLNVLACHLADKIESDLKEGREVKDALADFMSVFKKFS